MDDKKSLDVVNYDNRKIVCIPIEKKYLSHDNKFLRMLSNYSYQDSCKNVAYYKSTGKSNEINFENVWFPFMRVNKNGWIMKCFGMVYAFMNQDKDYFYSPDGNIKIVKDKKLIAFFNRFSFWWQLRISAILAEENSIWFTDENFISLRKLVLNYESTFKGFVKDVNTIQYNLNYTDKIFNIENVNVFLEMFDALCVKSDKYISD